jgi:iodotyrosine deiodinase
MATSGKIPSAVAAESPESSDRQYRATPLDFAALSETDARARSEDFLAVMSRRRSVRHFSERPVPEDLLENALRVAASAPSGANRQPWRFVVVRDPEVQQRIRDAAEHEEKLLYNRRASPDYLEAIEPIGTDWIKPHLTEAPVLVVVFELPWSRDDTGEKKKNYYVRESVGIAVGFFLVALHNAGLAALTHAPSPMGFLNEILERPENERPFLVIPVGYPADDATVPELSKKSLAEVREIV